MTSFYFPESYQDSRNYFRNQLDLVQASWPEAVLGHYLISEEEDLSIDWIDSDPGRNKNKVLLITTGLHGVEGFIGAGMVDLFLKEFLPEIEATDTALILVHALNPWGMANQRRFNRGNI